MRFDELVKLCTRSEYPSDKPRLNHSIIQLICSCGGVLTSNSYSIQTGSAQNQLRLVHPEQSFSSRPQGSLAFKITWVKHGFVRVCMSCSRFRSSSSSRLEIVFFQRELQDLLKTDRSIKLDFQLQVSQIRLTLSFFLFHVFFCWGGRDHDPWVVFLQV